MPQPSPEAPDLQRSVSALIKQGLALLLLWVFSGIVGSLPGADLVLHDRLSLATVLQCAIAVAVVVLLLTVRRPVMRVVQALVLAGLKGEANAAVHAAAARVAAGVTLLLYAVMLYGALARGFYPVLEPFIGARWPLLALRLAALAVAVAALVGVFRGASPIFGQLGDDLAGRVVAPAEPVSDLSYKSDKSDEPAPPPPPGKCPKCGVLNDEASEYCKFCGRYLAQDRAAPRSETTCAACGARVGLPARFCSACGKPIKELDENKA